VSLIDLDGFLKGLNRYIGRCKLAQVGMILLKTCPYDVDRIGFAKLNLFWVEIRDLCFVDHRDLNLIDLMIEVVIH
jgi:hypothetical protein